VYELQVLINKFWIFYPNINILFKTT
jgi:hypothetical protein